MIRIVKNVHLSLAIKANKRPNVCPAVPSFSPFSCPLSMHLLFCSPAQQPHKVKRWKEEGKCSLQWYWPTIWHKDRNRKWLHSRVLIILFFSLLFYSCSASKQSSTSVECSLLLLCYKGIDIYDNGLVPKSRCMHHPGKLWFVIARSRTHSRWATLFLARAIHWLIMRTAP